MSDLTQADRGHERSSRRGWTMAAAGAGSNFIGFGVLFSFGLFLTPLVREFETTTGLVAPLFSGSVGAYYLAGAVGGRLGDRFGARPVVAFGAVALPLGLLLSSFASRLWLVYLLYVPLVGLAVGSCYSPLIGAVGRWSAAHRARAIAVVLTGVGAGSLVMPLLIRLLLDRMDWRGVFRILAVMAVVVLGATALSIPRLRPDQRGPRSNPLAMFASRPFRRLYLSVVLIAPGFYAPLAFLNDYATSRGISTGRAALLLAVIGLWSVASRIPFGALAGRVGPLRQYQASHVVFLIGLVIWLVADGSYPLLLLSAALHGVAWAAWVTAAPLVLAGWFGVADLGLLVGGFYTGLGLGALIGPVVSGFVIDAAGYRPAIAVVIVTSVVSLLVLLTVGDMALFEPVRYRRSDQACDPKDLIHE